MIWSASFNIFMAREGGRERASDMGEGRWEERDERRGRTGKRKGESMEKGLMA